MNYAGPAEETPARSGLELTPFRGLRYDPDRVGSLAAVTSPPYDVIVRPDGLLHLESADPHNIVRLILPQDTTPTARNRQAADTLHDWVSEGVLTADPEPGLYVYEQHDDGMLQRGIIGALRLSEPSAGVVLPHEDVMPHIIADRAALMRATSANLEPLLLTYRGNGSRVGTAAVIERAAEGDPLLSTTTEDGFSHRLWAITDPADLAEIQTDLGRHQALIADGHHRWATYLRLRAEHPSPSPWDYGLVLLVDTARYPLRVRAIHRLLHNLPVAEALTALTDSFRVRHLDVALPEALEALAAAATEGNAFLLAGDGSFHLVDRPSPDLLARTVPPDRPEAWRTLDATVLHATLLAHVWGIPEDSPAHIAYIHDTAATVDKAERDGGTAVLMHPVREEVVRDLARQGVTMPRKSTSFGPKPASGLVLRALPL
ncbi:DUF1015 domain-containing protein [Streptomyces sp. NPDC096311]|uniref:DUF1015 domain-containing protein n=1 Tax=Streptomyces sp. NPDC096311 TaxID=3366083 RepID=UPI00382255C9